jgi:hypothetical protein
MHESTDAASAPAKGMRAASLVAVTGSALAGLIHVVAAKEHSGDRTLLWLFIGCAVAQILWAVALLVRPTRVVLVAGIVLNGGAFVFWLLSRTTGVAFIDALREPEVVGRQDLAAAVLAVAAAGAAIIVLKRPVARYVLPLEWSMTTGLAALLLFAPVLVAGHSHDDGHVHVAAGAHDHSGVEVAGHEHESDTDHAHDPNAPHDGTDGHSHDGTGSTSSDHAGHSDDVAHTHEASSATAGGHDHTDAADPASGGHDHAPSTDPSAPGHDHPPSTDPGAPPSHEHPPTTDPGTQPTGPIISLDDPRLTPAQRAAAQHLIDVTRAGMAPFPTVEAVEAAGYTSIGDGGTDGYEHYVKWPYLYDAYELDPNHIESIVVKKNSGGPKTVASALYILQLGKTMADVPDIAGELTPWHYHNNLCFEGTTLVALADANGNCPQGVLLVTPPMMHVWMVEQPCGPFAGIDEHGVNCMAHEH